MRKLTTIAGVTTLAVASVICGIAPAAHAKTGDLNCSGGEAHITLTPGNTFADQAQNATITGTFGSCSSKSDPTLTGGTFTVTGAGNGSCIGPTVIKYTMNIQWQDATHDTSVAEGTDQATYSTLGSAEGSTIVAGKFKGDTGNWSGTRTTPLMEAAAECFIGLKQIDFTLDTTYLN